MVRGKGGRWVVAAQGPERDDEDAHPGDEWEVVREKGADGKWRVVERRPYVHEYKEHERSAGVEWRQGRDGAWETHETLLRRAKREEATHHHPLHHHSAPGASRHTHGGLHHAQRAATVVQGLPPPPAKPPAVPAAGSQKRGEPPSHDPRYARRDAERTHYAVNDTIQERVSQSLLEHKEGLRLCTDFMVRFLCSAKGRFEGKKPQLKVPRNLDSEKEWEAESIVRPDKNSELECVVQLRFGKWAAASWRDIVVPTAVRMMRDVIAESARNAVWARDAGASMEEGKQHTENIGYWVEKKMDGLPKEKKEMAFSIPEVGRVKLKVSSGPVGNLGEQWKSRIQRPLVVQISCTRTFAQAQQSGFTAYAGDFESESEDEEAKKPRTKRPGNGGGRDDSSDANNYMNVLGKGSNRAHASPATGKRKPVGPLPATGELKILQCRCCGKLIAM